MTLKEYAEALKNTPERDAGLKLAKELGLTERMEAFVVGALGIIRSHLTIDEATEFIFSELLRSGYVAGAMQYRAEVKSTLNNLTFDKQTNVH